METLTEALSITQRRAATLNNNFSNLTSWIQVSRMPQTLSAAEYKELGKRYYGRKDYQAACDAFTEVRDDVVLLPHICEY